MDVLPSLFGPEQHRCFCLPEEGLFLIRHSITTKSLQCLWALMPQSRHLYPCLMSPHNYITENAEHCSNSASHIYMFKQLLTAQIAGTHQASTVCTESWFKICSFMKFMLETTFKCMAVGMNKIFFHFFLAYHAITENEKM